CVVAHDSLLAPESLVVLGERGGARGDGPPAPPYDERAAGAVPGEAAAAVVLERAAAAGPRALVLLAAADGADGGAGEPAAGTLARVAARLRADDLAAVDGAARADRALDRAEREALVVPAATPLVATAAALGQPGAASALVP